MFSLPKSRVGERSATPAIVPDHLKNVYASKMKALLDIRFPTPDEESQQLSLSPEALVRFQTEFDPQIEHRLTQDLAGLRAWASKLKGAVLPIAGLLHMLEFSQRDPFNEPISLDTLNRAINLSEYLISH